MADKNTKEDPITIGEFEAIAQSKLPGNVYDYYASGADEQKALKRNHSAYDQYVEEQQETPRTAFVDSSI
jgi:(S)-2-hydroxy-acid oxidase